MSNGISIRAATIDDMDVILRHRREMYYDMGRRGEDAFENLLSAARDYYRAALVDGSYRGFLAEDNGEVVGGGGVVISPWPASFSQTQPRRAMILNMFVEHAHRRKGIARTLMNAMLDWCRAEGFTEVGLHASDEGRPLYESLGFTPTNEMRLPLR